MHIEKIKKLKNGKYKIIIDGSDDLITYDEVILKNNLLNKKGIDKDLIIKLNIDTDYYNIYNKVVKYIQVRLRSEKEIIKYLEKYKLDENEKDKIIEELKNVGFVNDLNFAKAYISDKMNLSNYGPNKIKQELGNHNIDKHIVEELINNIDYDEVYEKLYRLIKKKIFSNKKFSKYQLKSKILSYFINLGYQNDTINEIFDELYVEDNNIIKREYEKIYINLKRKYSGDELYFKIRQKLYQKGFFIEEINEVINDKIE